MDWKETRERLLSINSEFNLPLPLQWRIDLAGANLAGANLAGAYLVEADLAGANLAGANLAGANLAGADLDDAKLTEANLADITVSWQSRTLIAEILWRAAGNSEQEMLAVWVARKVEWCWEEWLAVDHPERGWALSTLAELVKDGDDAPEEFLAAIMFRKEIK